MGTSSKLDKSSTCNRPHPLGVPRPTTATKSRANTRFAGADTLSEIALRFDVGLSFLRQLNKLKSDLIRPRQKLRLRASRLEEAVHVVQEGETLTEIARRYRVSVSQLQRLNALVGDRILIGQKLRLKDAASTVHIVERGDALWEIARAYGISVYRLKMLNGLRSNRIYPGQELKLYSDRKLEPSAAPASGPRLATYVVRRGDYLALIARLHQMSVAEITRINKLKRNAVIHPGDRLKVRPMRWVELSEIDWDDLQIHRADTPKIAFDNGPYYFSRPRDKRQPNKKYYEGHPSSPRKTYRQAVRLWREFESKVGRMGRLSSRLEGWHIVLDPGHGGLDPGAGGFHPRRQRQKALCRRGRVRLRHRAAGLCLGALARGPRHHDLAQPQPPNPPKRPTDPDLC